MRGSLFEDFTYFCTLSLTAGKLLTGTDVIISSLTNLMKMMNSSQL